MDEFSEDSLAKALMEIRKFEEDRDVQITTTPTTLICFSVDAPSAFKILEEAHG